jgi:hypothetical protein
MLTFDKKYFLFAVVLFIIEVLIAVFIRDGIIRPYVGDFLVVILIYCAVRTFLRALPLKVAIGVLLFSYIIEGFQYLKIVEVLGLQNNEVAKTIIGYGFDWIDLVAYTSGGATILLLEKARFRPKKKSNE